MPELRPGQAVSQRYRVTPTGVGEAQVRTRVHYGADGVRQVAEQPWQLSVPLPAPSEQNFPNSQVRDTFDTDTAGDYRTFQPFSGEVAPQPRVSDSALRVTADRRFFSLLASSATPAATPSATIVEVGELAGGSGAENSLFTGLVKDQGNYVLAWYNHIRGETGFDVRVNGQLLPGQSTARLRLRAGDRFALVVAGASLGIFHGRDGSWTPIHTGRISGGLDLTDPATLAQFRHGAGMRGDAGAVSIASLVGRSR